MMRAAALEQRQLAEFQASDLVDLSGTPWRRIMLSARDNIWTLVDADQYGRLSETIWNVWHDGRSGWQWYAKRNVGPTRATVRMHREILIDADPRSETFMASHFVDHINGQTLDNRLCNLRWATKAENAANRRARGTAPSLDHILLELLRQPRGVVVPQEMPF